MSRSDLSQKILKSWVSRIPLIASVTFFLYHLKVVRDYAVDIPFMDEWEMLRPDALPAGLSLHWLFAQHNEHRIVLTKILYWASYRLDGLNLARLQVFNFLLYGLLIAFLAWFAKRTVPELPLWVIFSFLIFTLSTINFENHSWAFQSCIHFALLFFFAAVYFLFDQRQRPSRLLLGVVLAVLAVYSFASGIVFSLVLILTFSLFKLSRAFSAAKGEDRQRELRPLLLVLVLLAGALALYFVDYHKPGQHPSPTLPYTRLFWRFFGNVLSLGFGFIIEVSARWGFVCLLLILAPIVGELWKRRLRLSNGAWMVMTATLGILGSLAAISVSRAGFGLLQSKRSGYAELGLMLIPLMMLMWAIFLRERPRLKAGVIAGLWLFCALAFWNNWYGMGAYPMRAQERVTGLECVKNYYAQGGEARCPTIYYGSLTDLLEQSKKSDLSFFRKIQGSK